LNFALEMRLFPKFGLSLIEVISFKESTTAV
jgi:hypothetical protein